MNAREAQAWVRDKLDTLELPYRRVTGRTVSFQDLGRDKAVFVEVDGWKPNTVAGELSGEARRLGFFLSFHCN